MRPAGSPPLWAALLAALPSVALAASAGADRRAGAAGRADAQPTLQCRPWTEPGGPLRPARVTVPTESARPAAVGSALRARPPTLHVYDRHRLRPLAAAWVAVHPEGLFVAVDVHDDDWRRSRAGEPIDAGDAVELRLRLGLDDHGRARRRGRAEAADGRDTVVWLGATDAGPRVELWTDEGPAARAGSKYVVVQREPATARTRYEVLLPWHALRSAPGAAEALGFGVAVHARHKAGARKQILRAYVDAGSGLRPGALLPLALPTPPGPFATLQPVLLRQGAIRPELVWRARGNAPLASLQVAHGDWSQSCSLGDGPFDVAVHVRPAAHEEQAAGSLFALEASLADGQALAKRTDAAVPVWQTLRAARSRLAALEAHPAARQNRHASVPRTLRHVATLEMLLERERLLANVGSAHERQAQWGRLDRLAAAIAAVPLAAGADPWAEDLEAGRRASFEWVDNPEDGHGASGVLLRPTRAVPAGQVRPLVVWLQEPDRPDEADFLATFAAATAGGLPDAFVLIPWARGSAGAVQAAEHDVLALIDAVIDSEPVDAEAVSLAGFGLGASGAFSLALHAPEPFAAVALAAGGAWNVPLGQGLGENVRSVPFFLWHGGRDEVVAADEQRRIVAELGRHGVPFEAHLEPAAGHVLSPELRARMLHFLAGKRRAPAASFHYVADGPFHRSRSGIALRFDAALSPFPRLRVARGREAVRIEADGTDGLELTFGRRWPAASGLDVSMPAAGQALGGAPLSPRTLGRGAPAP